MSSLLRTTSAFALSAALLVALPLSAEPLVKLEGGAPTAGGVVTAWSGSGTKIELTLRAGADAKAVADAIQAGVPKVKAKVQGGKIQVVGKAQAELLTALGAVDFGGGGDDLGQLAAAAGTGDDSGSGSSLRAKKATDLAKVMADQAATAEGKIVAITPGVFPNVVLTVQVMRGPTGPEAANIKKNSKVQFKSVLKLKGTAVDWADEDTQLNAGAWYLRVGDAVSVKFGKSEAGVYEALLIARK
jgi:hypothetical protein